MSVFDVLASILSEPLTREAAFESAQAHLDDFILKCLGIDKTKVKNLKIKGLKVNHLDYNETHITYKGDIIISVCNYGKTLGWIVSIGTWRNW